MKSTLTLSGFIALSLAVEPNPPTWPSNVYVFDPSNPSYTQSIVNSVLATNGGNNPPDNGQFVDYRYAFLFETGDHQVDVQLGYYTSLMGLGVAPTDTTIRTVEVQNGDFDYTNGALCNFWRSAENFHTVGHQTFNSVDNTMLWAVSQACPLRRVSIDGNLQLYQYNYGCCAGYASGGYMSDATITGAVYSGSQQQFFTRSSKMDSWVGGNWNMVFSGVSNAPSSHCSNSNGNPFTTIAETPIIAEKPYLHKDSSTGKWSMMVPPAETNKVGPTTDFSSALSVDFSAVYVATEKDSAATITAKLEDDTHVVLTPGNYNLMDTINITKSNTVVLGIGFPTLISAGGKPCISVADGLAGVRLSQILFQAGPKNTPTLFRFGATTSKTRKTVEAPKDASDWNFIHDLFARVGGPEDQYTQQVNATTMVEINSPNVVVDGSWLWRADHTVSGLVYNEMNPVDTGMIVNGDNVYAYGLKVEHTLKNLVEWNGENGICHFYQSEFPYDVTSDYGTDGYSSYVVADNVQSHMGYGVGAYSYFRDHEVTVNSGIKTGSSSGVKFENSLAVFLSGNGGISHPINSNGGAVKSGSQTSYVC